MISLATTIGRTRSFRTRHTSLWPPNKQSQVASFFTASKTTRCVRAFAWRLCLLTTIRVTDYPRTLREWGYRFEQNFKGEIIEDLVKEHPQLADPKSLEAFRRKWHYMFEYAAAGYAKAYTALNCWTFARPVSEYKEEHVRSR